MAQVKIYLTRENYDRNKNSISKIIHEALIDGLKIPNEKKFQRFFPMESDEFIYPSDRTKYYTVVEINMFHGRSCEAKQDFTESVYKKWTEDGNFREDDLEITIIETPKENWSIRGKNGLDLKLNYKVEI